MQDMGQQVTWVFEPILTQEGPLLAPLIQAPMEVDENNNMPAQEDGAIAEDNATAE